MGIESHSGKGSSPAPARPIVAFDFDGTLTVRDSFIAFLRDTIPPARLGTGLIRLAPDLLRYAADQDRERLKTAAVSVWLAGTPAREVEAAAEAFAEKAWAGLMRPDALARFEAWGREGAERVIVTASPEITVAPFARRLGAERLLGTRLGLDPSERLTGAFYGRNCRGQEKVERLREAYGPDVRLRAAYGDTAGDAEMLAIAEEAGFRVFTQKPLPRSGEG